MLKFLHAAVLFQYCLVRPPELILLYRLTVLELWTWNIFLCKILQF